MILISKYLVPKGYAGITLFPFIFVKNRELAENEVLINHEKIHLQQQKELLILPFYIWYIIEFILRFCAHKSWQKAYRNISFEKEAYENETMQQYLQHRKLWQFIKYC